MAAVELLPLQDLAEGVGRSGSSRRPVERPRRRGVPHPGQAVGPEQVIGPGLEEGRLAARSRMPRASLAWRTGSSPWVGRETASAHISISSWRPRSTSAFWSAVSEAGRVARARTSATVRGLASNTPSASSAASRVASTSPSSPTPMIWASRPGPCAGASGRSRTGLGRRRPCARRPWPPPAGRSAPGPRRGGPPARGPGRSGRGARPSASRPESHVPSRSASLAFEAATSSAFFRNSRGDLLGGRIGAPGRGAPAAARPMVADQRDDHQRGGGRLAPGPLPGPLAEADPPGQDRRAGQEPAEVVGQGLGRLVAAVRAPCPGTSGRSSPGRARGRGGAGRAGTGSSWTTWNSVSIADGPLNGGRPVSIS